MMFSICLMEKSYVELNYFPGMGDIWENQPHLEEVLASPLFSLEKSFLSPLPPPAREMSESPENICRHCCSSSHKEGKDFIQLCVMKKVVYLRTFKREQNFIGYWLFLVERQGCGCVSAHALDGDLSSETTWRALVEMAVGRCEERAGACCLWAPLAISSRGWGHSAQSTCGQQRARQHQNVFACQNLSQKGFCV